MSTEAPENWERDLDALAAEAAGNEHTDEYIPGAEPEPAPEGPDPDSVRVIGALLQVTFQVAAARRGEHWALSDAERDALAEPAVEVLEKYAPDMALGPEVALVLAAGMVTAPRLMHDRALAEEAARAEAKRIKAEQEAAEHAGDDGRDAGEPASAGDGDQWLG